MDGPGLRERKQKYGVKSNGGVMDGKENTSKPGKQQKKEAIGLSVLDVLRILGGLFLLNCLLSYFITNDSVFWGWRPWFIRPKVVMRWLVRSSSRQPNLHISHFPTDTSSHSKVPYT